MASRFDDDDRPRRPRPRSRRKSKLESGVPMWVWVAGVGVLLVAGVVVAVVVSRKDKRDGAGGTSGTPSAGNREITKEEFQAIKKEDTLATLESRFGPAKRLGPAELDNLYLNMLNRGHDARLKISVGTRLRETYNIANPECYIWSGGGTNVYLIPAQGHPKAVWHLKWYNRESTDAKGEFHGETIQENFLIDG